PSGERARLGRREVLVVRRGRKLDRDADPAGSETRRKQGHAPSDLRRQPRVENAKSARVAVEKQSDEYASAHMQLRGSAQRGERMRVVVEDGVERGEQPRPVAAQLKCRSERARNRKPQVWIGAVPRAVVPACRREADHLLKVYPGRLAADSTNAAGERGRLDR